MSKQLERVQVVFNVSDSDQKLLHDHVLAKANYSGYIKRLIQRDIDCGFSVQNSMIPVQMDNKTKQLDTKADFPLNGFI